MITPAKFTPSRTIVHARREAILKAAQVARQEKDKDRIETTSFPFVPSGGFPISFTTAQRPDNALDEKPI